MKFLHKFILFQIVFIIIINIFPKYNEIPYFFLGILSLILTLFIIVLFYKKFIKKKYDIKDLLVIFLLSLNFFTLVPLTSSRSLSIYLLTDLFNYAQFDKEDVNAILINYVISTSGSEKRISEQISIGNFIELDSGDYMLSGRAKLIVNTSEIIKNIYGIK